MKQISTCISVSVLLTFLTAQTLFSQDVEWQQVLGGVHSEYLYDAVATPDYGFLLVGSSFSGKTGTKSDKGQGDLDYFLWKMDEDGKLEWQKSFGGSGSDFLYSAALTKDGGYILGGSSDSPRSGDKKEDGFGNFDFWILKLDPEGNEQWQHTLGGIGNDQLQRIAQTSDGGYIIGGTSDSSPFKDEDGKQIGNKSQDSLGNKDYWVVKLTATGEIEWEKTFGGRFSDELADVLETEDGYLVAGTSNSPASGNKKTPNQGMNDYWILRLDKKGRIMGENTYGGAGDDVLTRVLSTEDGFLLGGSSNSGPSETKSEASGNGTDFWVVKTDLFGNVLWDKSYDTGQWDVLVSMTYADEGNYLIGGYASTETLGRQIDMKGVNDYAVFKINSWGEVLWKKTIGGTGTDELKAAVQTRDGGYILAGNSDSKKSDDKTVASLGGNDYWVVKLGNEKKITEKRDLVEIFPNPTDLYVNIVIGVEFLEAKVEIYDMAGRKLQQKDLPYRSTAVNLQGYTPGVYVFKITVDKETESFKVVKKGNR